jgi:hypothetical protein
MPQYANADRVNISPPRGRIGCGWVISWICGL